MSKVEPLAEGAKPCIRCGYCCRRQSCGFGEWDKAQNVCKSLVILADGTTECAKFDEIVNGGDESWRVAPAFGAGCCSPLNGRRADLLMEVALGARDEVKDIFSKVGVPVKGVGPFDEV